MVFVGPSPESIESFGLKHTARELATKAGVPVVPGTKGLIESEDEAVKESTRLGFPVRDLCRRTLVSKAKSSIRSCSRQRLVEAVWD